MTLPDATAGAQMESSYFNPVWIAWLDFDDDPVRVTTNPQPITFASTGDDDLDGFTFEAVSPSMVSLSTVRSDKGGQDTIVATLSGIVGPDSDLLNIIADKSKWRGRVARFWYLVEDATGAQQGGVVPFATGWMSSDSWSGSPATQTVSIMIESYIASLTRASNRTYMDQASFDPGDNSASRKLGAANGATKGIRNAPVVPTFPGYPNFPGFGRLF